jgi:hypothetical protein
LLLDCDPDFIVDDESFEDRLATAHTGLPGMSDGSRGR